MAAKNEALKSYRELEVWKKGIDLVEMVYRLTKKFPPEERFGLTAQMQRAAVSIPANVAEGYGRSHRGDYLHHLSIAKGSLYELETHVTIAARLGIASREQALEVWHLSQEVSKMLYALVVSLSKQKPVP